MTPEDFKRFRIALSNEEQPLPESDPRYVAHLHSSGMDDDVIEAMRQHITDQALEASQVLYFTGQRGTGKSTELLRLEALLSADDATVIRFDCLDYIGETEKVTAERVLLLVVAALADWAKESTEIPQNKDFLNDGAWTRFSEWLQSDVEITEISQLGLKAAIKSKAHSVAKSVNKANDAASWIRKVQGFAEEIVGFIRRASGRRRIVVIADSLERLRAASVDDQLDAFRHVVSTFARDVDQLRIPSATAVYAVPPYLTLLANVRNQVRHYALASVRVFCKPKLGEADGGQRRLPRPEGLERMRNLIAKRYPDWEKVMTAKALDALSMASGGDLRHFTQRLVHGIVRKAQYAQERLPFTENDSAVLDVIEANRVETLQLTTTSEWPLLAEVSRLHNVVATDRSESLATLAHLMDVRVVLNYRNGSEWFDIHPLLWKTIDALQPASAEGGAKPTAQA